MKLRTAAVSALLLCAASPLALAAGDAAKGRTKAEACLGCHNIPSYNNVYPTYHVPKVWGQHAAYIVSALQAYKKGDRTHGSMNANAAALSDADMADIAAYFSSAGK